jgi:glycosyltransferase involved in cell wall biosynthesis
MKILFVRTYCPNPIFYGSEMRCSRFVDYFKKKGRLDLLTLSKPTEMADRCYIKNNFTKFHFFDQKGDHLRLTAFEKFVHLLPWQIMAFYAKDLQERLNRILLEEQYDLIFIFKLDPVFYFLQLPGAWHKKIVIDFDDIVSDLYRNHYKNPLTAVKNSCFLKHYENRSLERFKRVFVCSSDAVLKISPKHRQKVGIVPNIFQTAKENHSPAEGNHNRILFVGSLDYFPNTEGLKWFFDVVWPQVKKTYPPLRMTVAGKAFKDPIVMASFFGNPEDVDFYINVPSVMPYYQDCFASFVPLLNGSGTRLKILESVAYGRPVISTVKGMEGLDFDNGKSIFVFQDAQSFLDAYKALLNKECYANVVENALSILKQRYSLNAFISSMDENWQRIIP